VEVEGLDNIIPLAEEVRVELVEKVHSITQQQVDRD
jgi:hypothetical protein